LVALRDARKKKINCPMASDIEDEKEAILPSILKDA
jgi:hypothetical protein